MNAQLFCPENATNNVHDILKITYDKSRSITIMSFKSTYWNVFTWNQAIIYAWFLYLPAHEDTRRLRLQFFAKVKKLIFKFFFYFFQNVITLSSDYFLLISNNVEVGMNKNWFHTSSILIKNKLKLFLQTFLGITFRSYNFSNDTIMLISYPGELFLQMLKLLTLPMLISSLITVSANLNARISGKIVSWTIVYFASTSMFSATLGIFIALSILPSYKGVSKDMIQDKVQKANFLDSILDLGRYVNKRPLIASLK